MLVDAVFVHRLVSANQIADGAKVVDLEILNLYKEFLARAVLLRLQFFLQR